MKRDSKRIGAVLFDVDSTFYSYPVMTLRLIWKYWPFIPLNAVLMLVRKRLRKMGQQANFRESQAEMFSRLLHVPERWGTGYLDRIVYRGWNQDFAGVPMRKGLRELLDFLVGKGVKIGIITDYPPEVKVKQMGLGEYPWEFMINCEETGALKPNPHGFKKALNLLQLSPEEVMYVGDKYHYDIRAPASLGMRTAWLTRRRKTKKRPEPDIYVRDFRELKEELEKVFEGISGKISHLT